MRDPSRQFKIDNKICVYYGCKTKVNKGQKCDYHKKLIKQKEKKIKEDRAKANKCYTKTCINSLESGSIYCTECMTKKNKRRSELNQELKVKVLTHYSKCSYPICGCCYETNTAFLSIDHINNDGAKHRRELKGESKHFYRWLKKNNFPEGFQVLCMNCNFAKGKFGECPHKTLNKEHEPFTFIA